MKIENFRTKRRSVLGIFGDLFDFNGDGTLDFFEQAAEFGMLTEMFDDCEDKEKEDSEPDTDDIRVEDFATSVWDMG